MSFFPMYIELSHRPCLIVGGGTIAYHKLVVLLDFGATVTVIAPFIMPKIKEIKGIHWVEREYCSDDLNGISLVVSATDNEKLNHRVSMDCINRNIPINAVDQIEDCTFIFPSYVKEGDVVASFSSGGNSPIVTQYLKHAIKPMITKQLSVLCEWLGEIRPKIKTRVSGYENRKVVYEKLFHHGMTTNQIPTNDYLEEIINESNKKN